MLEIKEAQKLGLVQNPVALKIILRAADAVCETGILRQPGEVEEDLWVGEGDTKFIQVCVLLVSTVFGSRWCGGLCGALQCRPSPDLMEA